MRVSSNKDDAGFRQFEAARANGESIIVFLDGVEIPKCIVADEEQGIIEHLVLDADGNAQIDPNDRCQVWTKRVSGKVRIEFR